MDIKEALDLMNESLQQLNIQQYSQQITSEQSFFHPPPQVIELFSNYHKHAFRNAGSLVSPEESGCDKGRIHAPGKLRSPRLLPNLRRNVHRVHFLDSLHGSGA